MIRILLACLILCVACSVADAQEVCHTYGYEQQLIKADPQLAKRIQEFARRKPARQQKEILNNTSGGSGSAGNAPIVRIPVVVHVLYNNEKQNISDEQIQSQIDALNRDFRRLNEDTVNAPEIYRRLGADIQIEFVLANVDPKGFATSGIVRRKTNIQFFNADDRIKFTSRGGDDAWDPESYLNIWTGNLVGNMLGYSSPVYGPRNTDGIVVSWTAFGTVGVASPSYNKGRTAVHEVGHWLGLRHIWGDRYCGDDYIDDTPSQERASFGCPSGNPISCDNGPHGNMYMNYMDATADACVNLFTQGQKEKMLSLFEPGEYRESLLYSKGAAGNGLPAPAEAPPGPSPDVIALYPNPVQSVLTIDLKENPGLVGQTISVYNHLGQLVMQERISKPVMTLRLQTLHDGIYWVKAGDMKARKVVKSAAF